MRLVRQKTGRRATRSSIEQRACVDPVEGVDACSTSRVEERHDHALVEPGERHRASTAGPRLAPAFVDPHVHLRTPGREDEEDIASGTTRRGRGGRLLRHPRDAEHRPGRRLGRRARRLVERARAEAEVPVGFLAAITKGQEGERADRDGRARRARAPPGSRTTARPVVAPGLMRRALQYNAAAGRPIALHCEEPTLSRGGHMHEGAVSAELGFGGYPSVAESTWSPATSRSPAYESRPLHLLHLSARESVEALRRARAAGVAAVGRGHAAPPLPHGRGGALARPEREDEPAAASRGRPARARRSAPRRDDRGDRDRPRAARPPREGRAVRGGAVRRHRARDGVRRPLHAARPSPGSCRSRRCSSG